jgi:hypothetical protein
MNTEEDNTGHQHSFDFKPKQEKEPESFPEMQLKDLKEFEINLPKMEALLKDNKNGQGSFDHVVLKDTLKTYKRMRVLFNKVFFLCGNCGHLIAAYPNYKAVILLICYVVLDFILIISIFSKIDSIKNHGLQDQNFYLFILISLMVVFLTVFSEVLIISKRKFRRIFLKSDCTHCGKKVINFERIVL